MVRAPCTRRRAAAGGGGTGGLAATETQFNSGRGNPACIISPQHAWAGITNRCQRTEMGMRSVR